VRSILSGIFQTDQDILILDEHGSHVTLETSDQTNIKVGHENLTITYFTCLIFSKCELFKPFKREKNNDMVINNYNENTLTIE
jgi:hypothetical protein